MVDIKYVREVGNHDEEFFAENGVFTDKDYDMFYVRNPFNFMLPKTVKGSAYSIKIRFSFIYKDERKKSKKRNYHSSHQNDLDLIDKIMELGNEPGVSTSLQSKREKGGTWRYRYFHDATYVTINIDQSISSRIYSNYLNKKMRCMPIAEEIVARLPLDYKKEYQTLSVKSDCVFYEYHYVCFEDLGMDNIGDMMTSIALTECIIESLSGKLSIEKAKVNAITGYTSIWVEKKSNLMSW